MSLQVPDSKLDSLSHSDKSFLLLKQPSFLSGTRFATCGLCCKYYDIVCTSNLKKEVSKGEFYRDLPGSGRHHYYANVISTIQATGADSSLPIGINHLL